MAEKTINNPSLLPDDLPSLLDIQLSGNNIIAISGHPVAGSGGGTVSDLVYYPEYFESTGDIIFHLGTSAHGPEPGGYWHIRGADGTDGTNGTDGKNPVFEIDSNNAHWKWKYAETTSGWTDLGVVASGAIGPKGQDGTNGTNGTDGKDGKDGTNGKDGVSPTVSTEPTTGGTIVTFTYGTGQTESITVLNGTPGAAGASGYSPEITLEPATSVSYPNGGTKVTITDLEHQAGQEFYVWNGNDGQGATVNLLEGTGIKIEKVGQDYTIGVSGDYASTSDVDAASANAYDKAVAEIPDVTNFITKDVNNLTYYYDKTETSSTSEITNALNTKLDSTVAEQTYQPKGNYATTSDISDMATQTWVGQQGYLTSIPNTYALKSDVEAASANALSEAESWVVTEGYLKAVPDSYATKTYANEASANALSEAESWVGQRGFITKNVDDLTYYYKKTETSSTSEITNALSAKLDSTVAAQTYQTKADMTNYLTTSDASTTYQPKGNYATTSDISDMATKTWVGQEGYLKQSALNGYATETYADSTSAEALSQAKTWVNQQNFATSAGLAANTRYEMTNTGWTSAIKIQVDTQVPTTDDGILHIILES